MAKKKPKQKRLPKRKGKANGSPVKLKKWPGGNIPQAKPSMYILPSGSTMEKSFKRYCTETKDGWNMRDPFDLSVINRWINWARKNDLKIFAQNKKAVKTK